MFDRITRQTQLCVIAARDEAARLGHASVAPGHLLLGLLQDDRSAVAQTLEAAGLKRDQVRTVLSDGEPLSTGSGDPPSQLPFTVGAKRALELALNEALVLGQRCIEPRHIALALLNTPDVSMGRLLNRLEVDHLLLRDSLVSSEADSPPAAQDAMQSRPFREALRRRDELWNSVTTTGPTHARSVIAQTLGITCDEADQVLDAPLRAFTRAWPASMPDSDPQ
jgi:ATP-dependent Clp protease ATP-binding subunit ClpC